MAELLDGDGNTIEGFERQTCLFENVDGRGLPMHWGEKDGGSLAGQAVQLRFFLRDAKIYGLSGVK